MCVCACIHLLQQDRLESGIQLLSDVLQQAGFPEADGVLQIAQEVPVAELHHLQSVVLLLGDGRKYE